MGDNNIEKPEQTEDVNYCYTILRLSSFKMIYFIEFRMDYF